MEAAVWGRLLAGGCQNFPSWVFPAGQHFTFLYTHPSHIYFILCFFVCLFVCFSLVFIDGDGGKNRVT